MEKEKNVDYFQVMRDFDRSHRKKADDFDIPLQSSDEPVDYVTASKEFEKYLIENPDVIHIRK